MYEDKDYEQLSGALPPLDKRLFVPEDPSPSPSQAQSQSQSPVVKADWAGSGNCWQTHRLDRCEDNNIFITGMRNCGLSTGGRSCEPTGLWCGAEFYTPRQE